MGKREVTQLSRRERQIMDVLFRLEEASVADVRAAMTDAPAYSSVRTFLTKLLEKGQVTYRMEGTRYIYRPLQPRAEAAGQAVNRLVRNFFRDRPAAALMGLLGEQKERLSESDLLEIEAALEDLKRERRRGR
ncbi:MAG: BlaI/MecI/CopY family transcriptional regulator [Pseudomonadota bacterium]